MKSKLRTLASWVTPAAIASRLESPAKPLSAPASIALLGPGARVAFPVVIMIPASIPIPADVPPVNVPEAPAAPV